MKYFKQYIIMLLSGLVVCWLIIISTTNI